MKVVEYCAEPGYRQAFSKGAGNDHQSLLGILPSSSDHTPFGCLDIDNLNIFPLLGEKDIVICLEETS